MEERIWRIPKSLEEAERRVAGREPQVGLTSAANVGLRDLYLGGWFNSETGELYRGIPVGPQDVVVDVGCGDGGILSFCSRQGARIVGIDVDASALERARQKNEANGKAAFLLASGEGLPLPEEFATRVLCTEVLEHVESPARVMSEIRRICKPGAIILLTVPDPASEEVQRKIAPPDYFERPNHVRIFERDEFSRLVVDAGFEIVSTGGFGFFWSVWWSMFWSCDVDFSQPFSPALASFTAAWDSLLSTKDGARVKAALDSVMPKSQLVVARNPTVENP